MNIKTFYVIVMGVRVEGEGGGIVKGQGERE